MPRALVTGIDGQDGQYLAEFLVAKGYETFGMIRGQANPKRQIVGKTWVTLAFLPFLIAWRGQWRALVDVPAE